MAECAKVDSVEEGMDMVRRVIRDGSAKRKFVEMLLGQGVRRSDVKDLFRYRNEEDSPVLPSAMFRTHFTADKPGMYYLLTLCRTPVVTYNYPQGYIVVFCLHC